MTPGSAEANEFTVFENRLLNHKKLYFKGLAFPYVKQGSIVWKLYGPYENEGELSKKFEPEKDISKEPQLASSQNEKFRKNIFLINNQTITYKNINITCSTLWSHIHPQNEFAVRQNVNDFHLIKMNDARLTPSQFDQLHQTDLSFLKKAIAESDAEKTIVIIYRRYCDPKTQDN